jgi:hypothetical protein
VSCNGQASMPDRDRDLAADLRLRPERPPVTRLSRRGLMGLAGDDNRGPYRGDTDRARPGVSGISLFD